MTSMERDYCPRCREIKSLRVTERMISEAGPDGMGLIKRRDAHCATCGTFVSATEAQVPTRVAAGSD